jgi:hypothetical protein
MITEREIKDIIDTHYCDSMKPMREISYDSANNKTMVDIPERFYSYDDIVGRFYREQQSESLRSPDMILFKGDSIIFVEFKNGKIDEKVYDNIKVKAIDGGIIAFHEIASRHYSSPVTLIDIINLDKSFVLVYNETKNPSITTDEVVLRNGINGHVKATEAKSGIGIYKDKFFKDVNIYAPGNFVEWLKREKFIPGSANEDSDNTGGLENSDGNG